MKLRAFSLLLTIFLVISPVSQALGQCVVMGGETAMVMTQGIFCQDDERTDMCVSAARSANTQSSSDEGCFSGNFCSPHFYGIHAQADVAKPLFAIPLLLAMPERVERLKQAAPPEIKPPITIA